MAIQPSEQSKKTRPNGGRRAAAWAIGMILAAGVADVAYMAWPRSIGMLTDADTIRRPEDVARLREILWKPPERYSQALNTEKDDYEPRISRDGRTLYFVRGKAGANADIYVSHRADERWADGRWTQPKPLVGINTEYDELGPAPGPDGLSLYFYSDRPGGEGGYDIWLATRASPDGSFADPINLGLAVNSAYCDYGPTVTQDSVLFFSSNRPKAGVAEAAPPSVWSATLREGKLFLDYDIYMARMSDSNIAQALPVAALNTDFSEGAPSISPAGDFIYFASDRPDGAGGFDLYRTRWLNGGVGHVEPLGDAVNSRYNDLDPALHMGGFGLLFSSDRPVDVDDARSDYNLYHTVSREVFREVETLSARIDWWALWSRIGPNLLWALLVLLLMLALLRMMRGVYGRRLSLLARCLLASLLAHMLLLFLLNLWEVTGGIAETLGGARAVHVTLAPPGGRDALAAQIRAGASNVSTPTPTPVETSLPQPTTSVAVAKRASLESPPVLRRPPLLLAGSLARTEVQPSEVRREPTLPDMVVALIETAPLTPTTKQIDDEYVARAVAQPSSVPAPTTERIKRTATPAPMAAVALNRLPAPPREFTPKSHREEFPSESMASLVASARPVASPGREDSSPTPAAPVLPAVLDGTAIAEMPEGRQAPAVEKSDGDAPTAMAMPSGRPTFSALAAESTVRDEVKLDVDPVSFPHESESLSQLSETITATPPVRSEFLLPAPKTIASTAQVASMGVATERMEERSTPQVAETSETPTTTFSASTTARLAQTDVNAAVAADKLLNSPELRLPSTTWSDVIKGGSLALGNDVIEAAPAADMAPIGIPVATLPAMPPLDVPLADSFLPPSEPPDASPYGQRAGPHRKTMVRRKGGDAGTERGVALALKWLAEHQSPDGHWDGNGFDDACGECGGQTNSVVDVGITGLSLLCFLGADHTHDSSGPYQETVRRGIAFLLRHQRPSGDLRHEETMYSHGMATIALAESLSMTGDEDLRDPVERAVAFIEISRNRRKGGWRYDPGQAGDTSVLGWQVMALKSARVAGIEIPWAATQAARVWLDRVSTPKRGGLYAYRPGEAYTPSMTAEGMFTQYLLGRSSAEPRMIQSRSLLLENLPDFSADPNTYYWYYGTLAMFMHGGKPWDTWNEAIKAQLLPSQHQTGSAAGSWDPADKWSKIGGRVYQTALCTLMLEVYYRYAPGFASPVPPDAIGKIEGLVASGETGMPLPNASVRLDVAEREALRAISNGQGRYELFPPDLPTFFAVSATCQGYQPKSVNVASAMVAGTTLKLDFSLEPLSDAAIALEADPVVHHLGDDRFDGKINSRFQRSAEGAIFHARFEVAAERLGQGFTTAELTFLVKGVQRAHLLFLNGSELETRLSGSPRDGSFARFTTPFDIGLLKPGRNRFRIHATSVGGDVDDFEFVNVSIRLWR